MSSPTVSAHGLPSPRSGRTGELLCNVDLLRCFAAMVIVVWHYQQFYYPTPGAELKDITVQPLYPQLAWLYQHGYMGVQFFWLLSGFIFFHAYAGRQQISGAEFFINRFSRLYPLHVLTLLLVAALQWLSLHWQGQFQVYPFNDAYHFVLNLFMASHWGFQKGWSFNVPIWSVSVEVLTYAAFFAYLKTLRLRWITAALWLGFSWVLYRNSPSLVLQCTVLFALGGVLQQSLRMLHTHGLDMLGLGASTLALAGAVLAIRHDWLPLATAVHWLAFPSLIALAAGLDYLGVSSGRLGLALGRATYASYLLHIPVQLVLILVLDGWIGSRAAVNAPVFLLGYLGVVLVLSLATYRWVELPLKHHCKALWRRLGQGVPRPATAQTGHGTGQSGR